ncbi:hypothetical protein CI109_103332 [Kwoniella shandongensis]|uniref:Uncharacterized protein n=1 Tax=Kwoniella shandongensis TaxID=1734106 RepID=A0A5M6BYZ9_9TREE|nr:uncharacterized protein CI109_004413 [Kwoniella shandongensis]KAA5527122.1 hypothetical protein CI109_004413 [Kwoniella shandongensis]
MVRERSNKPYQRSEPHRKANPDAPGSWKHDLHQSVKSSLASRLSSSSASGPVRQSSLAARISGGQGKELLPSSSSGSVKLHGFDRPLPANPNNLNAGVELLPSTGGGRTTRAPTRSVNNKGRELLNAALGVNAGIQQRREVRRAQPAAIQQQPVQQVSIMGAARGTTWVRVENLALGTTAEDVISAFAPLPVLEAKLSSPPNSDLVSVDLELEQRSAAEDLIRQYHGVVADGNTLSVTIVNTGLKNRLGGGGGGARTTVAIPAAATTSAAGQELLGPPSSGKLYSDTVLASNPNAAAITLSDGSSFTPRQQRSEAWIVGGPSLAQRMDRRGRGRGQIGGGSYADMMVD